MRVNGIAPATVLSDRVRRRLGEPDDVALATLLRPYDCSSWLTGVTLDVTGG